MTKKILMNNALYTKLKRMSVRFMSYAVIGLFTTGGMWVTWNALYVLMRGFDVDQSLVFSLTQYVASGIWIAPSFYLNRKLTFRDKSLNSSRTMTMGKVLLIYSLAPLIASFATYGIQKLLGLNLEEVSFGIRVFGKAFTIPYLYFGLQIFGIGIAMMLNFFGQYFLVYTAKKHVVSGA